MASGAPQLDLGSILRESRSLTILDTIRCDGNFMVIHYLVTALTRGQPVVLVAVAQIFNHYAQAAKKLGFNLAAAKDSGLLVVIDGVTNLQGWNASVPQQQQQQDAPLTLTAGESNFCQSLYKRIKRAVEGKRTPLVLIDDLSSLVFSSVPPPEALDLVNYLQRLAQTTGGNFVFLVHSDEELDDEDYVHFVKSVLYRSTSIVKLNQLESGYSRDVDGEISLLTMAQEVQDPRTPLENKSFHFKLTETSVKLLAKGLSAGFV